MDRIAPAPKDRLVSLNLPKMINALDAREAAGSVLEAVGDVELARIEAMHVMELIESYSRTLKLTDTETSTAALDADHAQFV